MHAEKRQQLTVFCSSDLEDKVTTALDHAGAEGFVRLAQASGNKFNVRGRIPRSVAWEAVVIVVPAERPDVIDRVVRELSRYAGDCEIAPCLRMTVCDVSLAV